MNAKHDELAGNRLRKARLSAGHKSAADAARMLGISPVTYTSHENNTRGFTSENAIFYGERFKVNPAWLLFGDEYASPGRHDLDSRPRRNPTTASNKHELKILVLESVRVGTWQIPQKFWEHIGVHPDDARIAECVRADSSPADDNPLAQIGDFLVIDTADTHPDPLGLFAVRQGEHILLKELRILGTSGDTHVEVGSPFSAITPYRTKLEKLQVYGRVKGRMSRLLVKTSKDIGS